MKEFEIDEIAQQCLLADPCNLRFPETVETRDVADRVRHRILKIDFDCTPNWGIRGVVDSTEVHKRNWYFRDPQSRRIAQERYSNIDFQRLSAIVGQAAEDLVDPDARVVGYGVYGSYFYRRNALLPEDLDVLVITEGTPCVAIDALRYRTSELRRIYINQTKPKPSTDEIGLSIVSVDSLNPGNRSYVVTDCALLDVSTTLSQGKSIDAPPLPPFIIAQNAQKIVRWGIASLLSKPFSLLSRVDEAIRMRQMLIEDNKAIGFEEVALEEGLPPKVDILLGMNDLQLLEISKTMINVLHEDERRIREYVAQNLELKNG